MKKLLIATDSFLPRWDGIARFLNDLLPEIKNKYEITVLAPEFPGGFQDIENVKVIRFPSSIIKVGDYTIPKPNRKLIKEHVDEADIIFTNSLGPIGAMTILCAHKIEKPIISYIHSIEWELFAKAYSRSKILEHIVYFFTKIYLRWLYNKCTLLMVPSFETGELLKNEKITTMKAVVPLGINCHKFIAPLSKKEAKEKLQIEPDNFVIGFTGRISREKDIETLYKAYKKLKIKYKNLNLLVIGEGLESLKNMLKEDKDVILPGAVDNVVPYLQAMDIFVLPSLTETSSLSTMEAMACGLPVIVTKVGNLKIYIRDKENGVFFPKKNVTVLSLKLDWLIEKEFVRRILGHNARDTIAENYQWTTTVEKIKKVLSGV